MQLQHLLRKYDLTILALATIAIVAAVYWHTFSRIIGMWSISYYEYGWLVYPISVYVLIKKRDELAMAYWDASKLGVLLVALLVSLWVVARASGIQVVEFLSATALIFATFWAIAGTGAMRKAEFPLLLLIAAVPMGEFLVEPLMRVTAEISSALLTLTGIPMIRKGQFFYLPGGSFEVADVCAGFRYLLAGTVASVAFSYVTYSSYAKRLIFVGLVGLVVVIANGVRAFIVMYVASATEMEILGGSDHVVFGMFMFAVVFVAMIWIGEGFADPNIGGDSPSVTPRSDRSAAQSWGLVVVTLVLVLAGPIFATAMQNRPASAIADMPLPELRNCEFAGKSGEDETTTFVGADYVKQGLFACGEILTKIYVASYSEQSQGKELISWANSVWPNETTQYVERKTVSVQVDSSNVDLQQISVRLPEESRLIWYWYQVGPSITSSPIHVKILETIQIVALSPVESSVVVVTVIGDSDSDLASLQKELETHVNQVLNWNMERADLGAAR